MKKVLMAEFSDIRFDARVLKQANTLSKNGFFVKLVMYNSDIKTTIIEKDDNIEKIHIAFPNRYLTSSRLNRFLRLFAILKVMLIYGYHIIRTKVEYYHAHNFFIGWILFISSKIHKGKYIYDFHELVWFEENKFLRFGRFIERIISKNASIHFCPSILRSKILKEYYNLKDNPIVLPNYPHKRDLVDDNNKLRSELNLSDDSIILFYSGMLSVNDRKQDNIIRALSQLSENIFFVIIGFGHQYEIEYMQRLINDLKLNHRVFIMKPKKHNDLLEYTSSADIGIALLDQKKVFNQFHALNKFYEYTSAGLATLTSISPQFENDLLDNGIGEIGLMCNENDVNDIINKLKEITGDIDRLKTMKKNARLLHKNFWNWEAHEEKLIKAYFKLDSVPS